MTPVRTVTAVVLTLLALTGSAQGACESPTTNSDLVVTLEEATAAFGQLEIDTFNAAAAKAVDVVKCLSEPVSRPSAAEYHRVQGIALFLGRNSPAAQTAFAAARSVEPDYTFPTDLVPEGNPIRTDYAALDPKVGPFEFANPPKSGSLRLNGSRSMNRAKPLPVIFQRLDGRGAVIETVLVEGDAALPVYEMGKGGNNAVDKPKEAGGGPNVPLLIGAAVGLVAAGGLYGAALSTKASMSKAPLSELESKRSTANTLVLVSAGVGVAAAGVGTTSFLVSGSF